MSDIKKIKTSQWQSWASQLVPPLEIVLPQVPLTVSPKVPPLVQPLQPILIMPQILPQVPPLLLPQNIRVYMMLFLCALGWVAGGSGSSE